jgi:hypothetical protein
MTIEEICKEYEIKNYTINPDGSIDVDGNVDFRYKYLTKLPLKFNKVIGSFFCYENLLTTLEGCPKEVSGHFNCDVNQLSTLEGAPNYVGGYFSCTNNKLTSLEGCPKEIHGDFYCNDNNLISLEGTNYIGKDFYCIDNPLPQEILDNPKAEIFRLNREKKLKYLLE